MNIIVLYFLCLNIYIRLQYFIIYDVVGYNHVFIFVSQPMISSILQPLRFVRIWCLQIFDSSVIQLSLLLIYE